MTYDTSTAIMADKELQYEDDGDLLFATVKAKPAVALLPEFVVIPDMVLGMADVTDEEMEAIFARPRQTDAIEDEWLGDDGWRV